MTIGERIKIIRKRNGYTQKTLAKELGVVKGTVCAWETGNRRPSYTCLDKMCDLFGLYPTEFFAQSEESISQVTEDYIELNEENPNTLLKELIYDFERMDNYAQEAIISTYEREKKRCMECHSTKEGMK